MNNTKSIFFFIVLISQLFCCDFSDGKLKLINNTDDYIYYLIEYEDTITSFPVVYKKNTEEIDKLFSNDLKAKEEHGSIVVNTKWERQINEVAKDSAIRIYFFKKDLVENVSEDSFLERQAYSKKFKLTVKDLEKMNWRVVYDGE